MAPKAAAALALLALATGGPQAALGARQLQDTQQQVVTFVPTGCQGLEGYVSQAYVMPGSGALRGTVTLTNPNTFAIPLQRVAVTLRDDWGRVSTVDAYCGSYEVPADPRPYQLGTLDCSFQARAAGWTSATAVATIDLSGATCTGSPQPLDGSIGGGSIGSTIGSAIGSTIGSTIGNSIAGDVGGAIGSAIGGSIGGSVGSTGPNAGGSSGGGDSDSSDSNNARRL